MKSWAAKYFSNKYIVGNLVALLVITYLGLKNYLLFHALVELFSIIIAYNMFIIVINTQDISQNNYLMFLGVAYVFVGGFDLLHTLAYKGMGVFPHYGANLPTQLWIIARFIEALSLLLAFKFISGKLKIKKLIYSYSSLTVILLSSIFYWDIFPACFRVGVGLTPFKKISEYLIVTILVIAMVLIYQRREKLSPKSYLWMKWAIITTILAELSFTLYADVYGLLNMLGHIFKLISFYLIYKAIIEISLKSPYTSLFKELTATNQQLKAERDKLNKYFDVSGVMIININGKGKIAEVNKKACQVLGYSEEELLGQSWTNFVNEKEEEKTIRVFADTPNGQSSVLHYGQNEIITKSGARRKILWTSNISKDAQGNIKRVLSSGLDITDYELLKKELEYNKLQVEFFANLSHELKTPLNLIFSALQVSDLYQENNLSEAEYQDLQGYTEIIKQNSQRLLRLVNNLIDITKIDTNSFNLDLKNVEIVEVTREITNSVKSYIESQNKSLKFETEVANKIIACDPFNLERILLNLLSNALKFTEEDDEIRVKISETENMIVIAVRDTGLGIPQEKKDLIFQRFRQIDKSLNRNAEGSGIGLTIVKLLVDLHDGVIEVDSNYGEFTEFKVKLPKKQLKNQSQKNINYQVDSSSVLDRVEVEFSDLYDL
ncbi:sensor histidine kinase [Halanaerobacter jeridensis]|uniref:histidine kinase n=1 Tax=Halanaerobacter jeridensis TaxID=706427 RepID=A0A938XUI9_9FIRM|nr:MASE3 domain-containing protein [Halanaerobacter jeridensis]MBM7556571.1 PAS domain S-box-containing protein [Halanaerobacter jeridensis]